MPNAPQTSISTTGTTTKTTQISLRDSGWEIALPAGLIMRASQLPTQKNARMTLTTMMTIITMIKQITRITNQDGDAWRKVREGCKESDGSKNGIE